VYVNTLTRILPAPARSVSTVDPEVNKTSSRVSKVNLVDLAGSERINKTGATGQQMKEGININKSLSVLGDCIEKLAKRAKDKTIHVPYRNSILTWLLKVDYDDPAIQC